ncbi:hypothetical protein [Blastococcus sp. SYSU DS0973]
MSKITRSVQASGSSDLCRHGQRPAEQAFPYVFVNAAYRTAESTAGPSPGGGGGYRLAADGHRQILGFAVGDYVPPRESKGPELARRR